MKKTFEAPTVDVLKFTVEDIITTSGGIDDGTGGGIGGDNETGGRN